MSGSYGLDNQYKKPTNIIVAVPPKVVGAAPTSYVGVAYYS